MFTLSTIDSITCSQHATCTRQPSPDALAGERRGREAGEEREREEAFQELEMRMRPLGSNFGPRQGIWNDQLCVIGFLSTSRHHAHSAPSISPLNSIEFVAFHRLLPSKGHCLPSNPQHPPASSHHSCPFLPRIVDLTCSPRRKGLPRLRLGGPEEKHALMAR